jgi:hypothetical protein
MKDAAFSLILVIVVEAISAVVTYLKDRLTEHMHRRSTGDSYHHEFA